MSRPFSLLVKPASADCNLRCRYCFYLDRCRLFPDAKHPRMGDAVLERMVRGYLATDQPAFQFAWQGGEPTLMGVDFYRRVVDLQRRYGPAGAPVSNGMQTNGTGITDEMAALFARNRFLVGISLDGPAEVHDRYRVRAGGGGSHAAVLDGVGRLGRHGAEFNILTLVSRANVDRPVEVYDYLCGLGVRHHQYIECVEWDAEGRPEPFAISGDEWGDFLCALFDRWYPRDVKTVSVRLFDAVVARLLDGSEMMCTQGTCCDKYFVVEHNGDIFPCDFFVDPSWRLGNVMTDRWADLQASPLYRRFAALKGGAREACAGCEFLPLCSMDCVKNRSPRGADARPRSALCEGWTRFYRHALPAFRDLADGLRRDRERLRREADRALAPLVPAPPPAATPGRNDACPCGSGKKFKKCCGRGERDES